jgi:hypothetical protein
MLNNPDFRFDPPYAPTSRAWRIISTPEQLEQWVADTQPYLVSRDASGQLVRSPLPGWTPVTVRKPSPGNN